MTIAHIHSAKIHEVLRSVFKDSVMMLCQMFVVSLYVENEKRHSVLGFTEQSECDAR